MNDGPPFAGRLYVRALETVGGYGLSMPLETLGGYGLSMATVAANAASVASGS